MKRNLLILAVLTLTVLFLTSFLVPAFAADGKSYPGSMAVPWGSYRNTPYAISFSSFGNDSATTTLKVDLPLINDGSQYIYSGKVKVLDMNPSQNFSIFLCAAKPYVNGGSATRCKGVD